MLFLCGYSACVALVVGCLIAVDGLCCCLLCYRRLCIGCLAFCLRVSCYVACLVLFCVDLLVVGADSAMRGSLCCG